MNKKEAQSITNDVLIADALLRVKTLENMLIAKGLFTREEYNQEMETVTKVVTKTLMEKSPAAKELFDKLLAATPKKN